MGCHSGHFRCHASVLSLALAGLSAAPVIAATGAHSAPASALPQQSPPPPAPPVPETSTSAQPTAPPLGASPEEEEFGEDIVVTGFRASLADALNEKRTSNQIIDAITAEDIADFPDANLAESIQRLPGVSIDRDNGEGRTITVRGLGGDFQLVRLNGADALSVAGGNTSDAGANRTRGFDFNTFASELFGGVRVTKSTAASNDEGSLGAIIDLVTGRPLAYSSDRIALGAEAEYRANGETLNPRLTGLFSKRLSDNFGILGSIAFQEQRQTIDAYRRSIGQFDYTYRNSQHQGKTPPVFGFAQPSTAGTGPTFGSDPAAYALVTPTTIIPALPSISRQELEYDRLGATLTAQWRPSDRAELILDGVYSRYNQESINSAITTVGLNRNGTNARAQISTGSQGLRAPNTANGLADRVALYQSCVPSANLDCGQQFYGGALVPGTRTSFNPNNLNPFDYYNSPSSPGFVPTANQTGFYNELIGRPSTQIRAANVNSAGQADYLVLDNLDWRSFTDIQTGSTEFKQATLNYTQELSDSFRFDATVGYSSSKYNGRGNLVEFNAIDRDNYVFDERDGGKMPVFSPGFDVANPDSWDLVKGLSAIRYTTEEVNNSFAVYRLNVAYDLNDELTLLAGGTFKRFGYDSLGTRRNSDIEAINPTLLEAGLDITELGRVVGFGQGLDVTPGTPTSFFAPDIDAFRRIFGVDCNCVNRWSDFRALEDGRLRSAVVEKDLSGYIQLDFDVDLFGRPLRGNAGVRVANTRVSGTGSVGGAANGQLGVVVTADNEYTDVLPATNLNWELSNDFIVRFATARVIARPQLQTLTPGTTSFPTGLNAVNAPAITVGNPYLSPFRATNVDLSFERYWGRTGLAAINFFYKDLETFPQQIAGEFPLSQVYDAETYEAVLATITSPTLLAYTLADGVYAVRQFNDAPGGTIKGVEINLQSNFDFLPAPWNNFGALANYTYIDSSLTYLTGASIATRRDGAGPAPNNRFAEGPFLNTSPNSFNATLYYEDSKFSARVSGAYRTRYVNRFPLSAGTCEVGTTTNNGGPCNSPVVADFGYTENTLNIDARISYALTDFARITLEGRNLTNSEQYRTMYEANPVSQTYASTGAVYTAGIRLIF